MTWVIHFQLPDIERISSVLLRAESEQEAEERFRRLYPEAALLSMQNGLQRQTLSDGATQPPAFLVDN